MARTGSLRARTNSVLGLSAIAIAIIAVVALDTFVTTPITERAANDEAGLLVLSAQTWVELLPDRRPHFELELLINQRRESRSACRTAGERIPRNACEGDRKAGW